MKVLFIGKYPPIQGGTSASAFWRIKGLEKLGISFEIITCISKDSEILIKYKELPKNVYLISEKMPWHIPYSQLYSERLISKALEIAQKIDFDIVEGSYLFPYGFSAYIIAMILNKPLILRHAGSDLYRIADKNLLGELLKKMAEKASVIVTHKENIKSWLSIYNYSKLIITKRYVPNPNFYLNSKKHIDTVFIGKITEKWNRKQLDYFYNFLKREKFCGKIIVYSNKFTIKVLKEYFEDKEYTIVAHSFVMPDKVPNILRKAKYCLISSVPSNIPEQSNVYLESLACGCIPICIESNKFNNDNLNYSQYITEQINIYKEALQ